MQKLPKLPDLLNLSRWFREVNKGDASRGDAGVPTRSLGKGANLAVGSILRGESPSRGRSTELYPSNVDALSVVRSIQTERDGMADPGQTDQSH